MDGKQQEFNFFKDVLCINDDSLCIRGDLPQNIVFTLQNKEVLRIEENGNFYVNGRLVINDMEVYTTFKEWLKSQGNI